ncbi:MAG TPA: class A beta-lactamase [Steroidobacteraceae bacterium]
MIRRVARLIVLVCVLGAAPAYADVSSVESLRAEIERIASSARGVVGVAAWRLDGKGPSVLVNAREPFPMASTYKVAIAGAIFDAVDKGRLKLDQMVPVSLQDYVPSEIIADRFIHPGVSLSVSNLLELMLTQSDNTATDVLMRVAGGAQAVTAWVRAQGIEGQRIDRDTNGILRDFFSLAPDVAWSDVVDDAELATKASLPNATFDNDPRDTSTPEAMARLLTRLFSGQALSEASTNALVGMMRRCRTGEGRLKGQLPQGSVVAHKTGTIGGTVNDVGVIDLPDAKGRIVIAVFVKKSEASIEQRERVIAEIARSVRDFYLFKSKPRSSPHESAPIRGSAGGLIAWLRPLGSVTGFLRSRSCPSSSAAGMRRGASWWSSSCPPGLSGASSAWPSAPSHGVSCSRSRSSSRA